jgi:ribonuclease J
MNLKKYKDDLLFLPLGGSGEIGMNLNLYHLDGKWIVVDCGIGFADDYFPGADLIVPDITFIEEIKNDIIGMVVTHAHEDHVGAIPYLWEEFECPVYTTKFTAEFLKLKLQETHFGKRVKIHEIKPNEIFELGPFKIEPINLTHSIPEMHAMAIHTRHGIVMHTGDWKFDDLPQIGPASNQKSLAAYGDKGVLALVCDSTNVFSKGVNGSEETVKENLTKLIAGCKERVAVGTFASNLARVQTIIEAGQAAGREIIMCGRSFWRLVEAAKEAGYLQNTPKLWTEHEIGKIPRNKQLLMCTGSQAESRAAFSRIAEKTHPRVKLQKGDTAIFSSKIIPGNEKGIYRMLNLLCLQGVEVITEKEEFIHVSGHPYRDELAKMYELTRPKIAIPVHGEARHIHEHAKFAMSLGAHQAFEPQNGDVYRLNGVAEMVDKVQSGYMAIDAFSFLSPDSDIMRGRRKMRENGTVFCTIPVGKTAALMPQISAPGLLDEEEDAEFLLDLADAVHQATESKQENSAIEAAAKKTIKKIVMTELDKAPVIQIHIVRL